MDELIKKIIEIEEQAKEIDEKNQKVISEIKDEAVVKEDKMKNEIFSKVKNKCLSIKEMEDNYAKEKEEKIFKLTKQQEEELKKRFEEKKERWVSDIVSDILS